MVGKSKLENALTASDFPLAIARDLVAGVSHINKFGENPDVDSTAEDIWDFGGAYIFSTTAAIDTLSSTNVNDLQDIIVEGLDSDWLEVVQEVTMNGQSKVSLTIPLIRINRAFNNDDNAVQGNIHIYENTAISGGIPTDGTKVRAMIRDGNNQSLMAIYSVPANKTAYMELVTWDLSRDKVTTANVTWRVQLFGKKFRVQHRTTVLSTGTSNTIRDYKPPVKIPPKSDIKSRCESVSTINTAIGSTFDLILVENQ